MKPVVFTGPTLWNDRILQVRCIEWLPPAGQGDLYRVARSRPPAIGLIDGRFESCPSVWHKEILWALAKGIPVYGAGSMGALRAVELSVFGMIGVGAIYRQFQSGELEDDDEVAVLHAPIELGYQPLTDAMVDIRATLAAAVMAKVLSRGAADVLTKAAKALFFKDRTWKAVLAHPAARTISPAVITRLSGWLARNQVQQKRNDALAMIRLMRKHAAAGYLRVEFDIQFSAHIALAQIDRVSQLMLRRRVT